MKQGKGGEFMYGKREGYKTITVQEEVYVKLSKLAEKTNRSIPKTIEHLQKNELRKGTSLCSKCETLEKVEVSVSEDCPLSSCELCEILQSFAQGLSCLSDSKT
jgi:predicted CopG family antitoxin